MGSGFKLWRGHYCTQTIEHFELATKLSMIAGKAGPLYMASLIEKKEICS